MSKAIPEFKNEDEERAFWATHDSSQYVDWNKARRVVFPNLRPTTRAISLRLPLSKLDELRQLANQRDVPYQSLIKVFLRDRIDQEYRLPAIAEWNPKRSNSKAKRWNNSKTCTNARNGCSTKNNRNCPKAQSR